MPPELGDEHVAAICRVLIAHGVHFVVIGGMAARLHDTGHATVDVDICPSTDDANLTRLASALADLGAQLRVSGEPEGVPFEPHADMLRQVEQMTLITEHGPLDLCFTPDGFPDGYETLSEHASVIEIAAVDVPVASLEDVVASKRAAGRPKDIVALPPLEARLRRP
jgi:hypothetical protein